MSKGHMEEDNKNSQYFGDIFSNEGSVSELLSESINIKGLKRFVYNHDYM